MLNASTVSETTANSHVITEVEHPETYIDCQRHRLNGNILCQKSHSWLYVILIGITNLTFLFL